MFLSGIYNNQLARYVVVAGLNVVAGYGVFALFIFLDCHYVIAVTASTIFGILFGFKAFSALVFNNKNNLLLLKYLLVWATVYLLNVGGLAVLDSFKVNSYLAGLIMMVPLAGLGFLLNREFVFKRADQGRI